MPRARGHTSRELEVVLANRRESEAPIQKALPKLRMALSAKVAHASQRESPLSTRLWLELMLQEALFDSVRILSQFLQARPEEQSVSASRLRVTVSRMRSGDLSLETLSPTIAHPEPSMALGPRSVRPRCLSDSKPNSIKRCTSLLLSLSGETEPVGVAIRFGVPDAAFLAFRSLLFAFKFIISLTYRRRPTP